MSELDLVQDGADHIRIILIIHSRKQQSKRIVLLKMCCRFYKSCNSILIMGTVYNDSRQYSFHSSLPACLNKSFPHSFCRYRNLLLKNLHCLESKRTVHHLIQCNERNGKYCVTIILILK